MDYYKQNEVLNSVHNYSIKEIENMYPFERDVYINLNVQRNQENQPK